MRCRVSCTNDSGSIVVSRFKYLYKATSLQIYRKLTWQCASELYYVQPAQRVGARATASGPQPPVRLVRFQPYHFFPHSWLAWHCQLAPLLGGRPLNAPKHIGTMLKLARWLRTVQQNCSVSLPTTFLSYKRTISLASFTCEGCSFRPISKLDRKADTIGV